MQKLVDELSGKTEQLDVDLRKKEAELTEVRHALDTAQSEMQRKDSLLQEHQQQAEKDFTEKETSLEALRRTIEAMETKVEDLEKMKSCQEESM